MPELGEIRYDKEIGKGNAWYKYIWSACPSCGTQRWVSVYLPIRLCRKCADKAGAAKRTGKLRRDFNPNWQGGKSQDNRGYIRILLPCDSFFYPMAIKSGYVLEHRLVVAQSLGRNLHSFEIVHHKNGNKSDNRLNNLELSSNGSHSLSHSLGYRDGYQKGLLDGHHEQIKLLSLKIKELEELLNDKSA